MIRKRIGDVGAALGLGLLILIVLSLVPVPPALPGLTFVVEGTVASVTAPGSNDISIWLEGDSRRYHINHGVDAGLDAERLHARLHGRPVRLQVIRRTWSPLDPAHQIAPVARVVAEDGVVFDVRGARGES